MEDGEGGLQDFDFEQGLESRPAPETQKVPSAIQGTQAQTEKRTPYRRNFRQTVCRHWLRGLCMKGNDCGFLHQYDKSRMPVCRFFAKWGECREPDCFFKHTNEDVKECNMYKLGFCPNGPECRYRHLKLPGPPPPAEQHLPRLQHRTYPNGGYHRPKHVDNQQDQGGYEAPGSHGYVFASQGLQDLATMPAESGLRGDQISSVQPNKVEAAGGGAAVKRPRGQEEQSQPAALRVQETMQQQQQLELQAQIPEFSSESVPLPSGVSRYFIVKSNNIENLDLSVKRGLWATHRNNESRLNDAYDTCDNVILIFSVNETRHFQGCAKMMSKIGGAVVGAGWKYANGTAHYGRNFRIKWLKLCQLSFQKTRHLRNPYNEDLPVKISRDCQELEPTVGQHLAKLLYLEPDSDLMAVAKSCEAAHEEEATKSGAAGRSDVEDAKIVPFEDGEGEEESSGEEEDEEDEDANSREQQPGSMGRGQTWYGGRGRAPVGRGYAAPQNPHHPGEAFRMPPGGPTTNFGGMPEEPFRNPMAGPGHTFPPLRPTHPGFGNGRPEFPRPNFGGPGPHFQGPDFVGRNFPRPDFPVGEFPPRLPFAGPGPDYGPRPEFPGPGFPGPDFGPGEFGSQRGYGGMMMPRGRSMGFRGPGPAGMFPSGGPGFMGPGGYGPSFMGPGGTPVQQHMGGERGGGAMGSQGLRPPMASGRGGMGFRPPFLPSGRGGAGRESPLSGEEVEKSSKGQQPSRNTPVESTDRQAAHHPSRRRRDEEEGQSEDEAPRRSRHKRGRRAWEEEDEEEEMGWDDYAEGADPWEAARQAETAADANNGEDNVDY